MSTPVVKVENLVKRYKELVAVDHFNLTIEEGEILGLWDQTVPEKPPPSTVFSLFLPMTKEALRYSEKK